MPVVTRSRLVSDLKRIGLRAGDLIMMHAAVSKVGWVVGGPDVVIGATLDVLTTTGTLMMYVGWEGGPYTMEGWSEERRRAYLEECPPFDPARSRAYRKWSILTEYLRTWPGSCRSGNPECSMAAVGAKASWLTADHPMDYGLGVGSPLEKLCQANGKVLLLGSPLSDVTLLHYAEHLANIPGKPIIRYSQPVLQHGRTVWVEVEEQDSNKPMGQWEHEQDPLEALMLDFLREGGTTDKVGNADSVLLDANELTRFAVEWLERSFNR